MESKGSGIEIEKSGSRLRLERIWIIPLNIVFHTRCHKRESKQRGVKEAKKGEAVVVLARIMYCSWVTEDLICSRPWSLHSSVLPPALFITPLCHFSLRLHIQINNKKKKQWQAQVVGWIAVIALLSPAALQELYSPITQIKLNTTIFFFPLPSPHVNVFEHFPSMIAIHLGSCHPDVVKSWITEAGNLKRNTEVGRKKIASWKDFCRGRCSGGNRHSDRPRGVRSADLCSPGFLRRDVLAGLTPRF